MAESLRKIVIAYIPLVQGDMKKALNMVLRAEILKMVGVAGFEPATLWSQTKCASQTALYPEP